MAKKPTTKKTKPPIKPEKSEKIAEKGAQKSKTKPTDKKAATRKPIKAKTEQISGADEKQNASNVTKEKTPPPSGKENTSSTSSKRTKRSKSTNKKVSTQEKADTPIAEEVKLSSSTESKENANGKTSESNEKNDAENTSKKKARASSSRKRKKGPKSVLGEVEDILEQDRVIYFPIKHFSPVCAYHVSKLIREIKPVGVLIEGPQDANALIPYIVHKDTRTPFTIFSSYVDKKNQFGLNGVLSPSEILPARFRGWWPMTEYAPEYAALKVGNEVGAKLEFCDTPLTATIPYHHVPQKEVNQVVNDRHLAENSYFDALRQGQRRRSFDEFWNANFETGGLELDTHSFMKQVLTFAYCARNVHQNPEALEADGTIVREKHMRFVLDTFLKNHKEGKVVVVTGAFHSVALPTTKKQKAKVRADKNLETLLTAHSFRALATLYELNRLPNYSQIFWEELLSETSEKPFNSTAMRLLLDIMRKARDQKEGLSTADGVEAYRVARNLAVLRKNKHITLEDMLDATQMAYVKGDLRIRGPQISKIVREVLIGERLGRVTSQAGQAPLIRDFYESCQRFKIDISGVNKVLRCDLGKQEAHRNKSAFLHRSSFLEIPMFTALDGANSHWRIPSTTPDYYKGPDLVSGENMHLIGETWGIKWQELVDDRLLELSDRGASLTQAAVSLIREELSKVTENAADTTRLLLKSAQMMLTDIFEELLQAVEDAIVLDSSFENLVKALHDFVVLYSYRDTVSTQGHQRLLDTVVTLFNKAMIILPIIANAEGEIVKPTLDSLQTLIRITLTFEAISLDQQLLLEKLFEMVAEENGTPVIRGAGYGILYSLGATREKVVARELESYLLGSHEQLMLAGNFLDGLFLSSKNIFMSSPRLLRAINNILAELDWDTFKLLLPDLRRAFTQFIPTEIDSISSRVKKEIGLLESFSSDEPVPLTLAKMGANADQQVQKILEGWL